MKKYELIAEKNIEFLGQKLFRIRALVSFGCVIAGEEGGYVADEKNLDRSGNAWVYGDALVYGDARVYGNAQVSGNARVYGDARVSGNALVYGDARVYGDAQVYGNARVSGNASILFFSQVGSSFGTLTAFRNKDAGITVTRGCFIGTLDEFRAKVLKTHGGTLHEKGYLGLANYIEWHFTELHPFNE